MVHDRNASYQRDFPRIGIEINDKIRMDNISANHPSFAGAPYHQIVHHALNETFRFFPANPLADADNTNEPDNLEINQNEFILMGDSASEGADGDDDLDVVNEALVKLTAANLDDSSLNIAFIERILRVYGSISGNKFPGVAVLFDLLSTLRLNPGMPFKNAVAKAKGIFSSEFIS